MLEAKEKALAKMNQEMNQEHSEYEDYIHNWLSDQEDNELFEAILKEGKTIRSCFKYIEQYAYKMAKRVGNVASYAPSPNQIHSLIVEYLKGEQTVVGDAIVSDATKPLPKSSKVEQSKEVTTKPVANKTSKKEDSKMLSIFDFGVDEQNDNDSQADSCNCEDEAEDYAEE